MKVQILVGYLVKCLLEVLIYILVCKDVEMLTSIA